MGTPNDDPFAEEGALPEEGTKLHPLPALRDIQECLEMVRHWRERAEEAEYQLWALELKRRQKLAKHGS